MPGDRGIQPGQKMGDLLPLLFGIILPGHKQRRDLDPDVQLFHEFYAFPGLPVAAELEQKLTLVTAVGQMPDLSRQIVPMGSRHGRFPRGSMFLRG